MKTGEQLRNEGTTAVLNASSEQWKFEADMVMDSLIASGVAFTSEDLRDRMTLLPHHPNAIGGYWIHAVKRYDLIPVGYTRAEKPYSRKHILPLWIQRGLD